MNTINDFATEVKAQILKLNTDIDIKSIEIKSVTKTNDINLVGIVISENDININPTIYIDSFYNSYKRGILTIKDVAQKVISEYKENKMENNFDTDNFTNFEKAKDNIIFKIINFEKNKKLLSDVPYVKFQDLAIVFSYLVKADIDSMASILIHNNHMKNWHTTTSHLLTLAQKNTEKLMPATLNLLNNAIFLLTGERQNNYIGPKLYVISNDMSTNGAGVILYKGFLKSLSKNMNDDFYLIPSSVHEMLLVKRLDCEKYGMNVETLNKMVNDVNATEVAPNEVLSDHIYIYSREEDKILSD